MNNRNMSRDLTVNHLSDRLVCLVVKKNPLTNSVVCIVWRGIYMPSVYVTLIDDRSRERLLEVCSSNARFSDLNENARSET